MKETKITNMNFKVNLIGFFLILAIIIILLVNPKTKDYFCHCSNHKTISGLPSKEIGSLGSQYDETPDSDCKIPEGKLRPGFFAVGV